jgi:O-acetyl-ADP-ribose deacetylase (regulator of RNase III)
VWYGGNQGEDELLASCYREALRLCVEHGLRSVAFPAISTGAYGYPLPRAAAIAGREVWEGLSAPGAPARAVLCTFGPEATQAYREALDGLSRRR